MAIITKLEDLMSVADNLYERRADRVEWLAVFARDDLIKLWNVCTDRGNCPAYDDEVYEALDWWGYFDRVIKKNIEEA